MIKLFELVFKFFKRLLPRVYTNHIDGMLMYAGKPNPLSAGKANALAWTFVGLVLLYPYLIFVAPIPYLVHEVYWGIAFFSYFFVHGIYYFKIFLLVEDRKRDVELMLPDFIQLVSSNLRSGLTPYKALRSAARPEFGLLADEVLLATSKSLGVDSFASALQRLGKRIRSEAVDRTIKLFTTAMQSGSSLADLLDEIAADLSENHMLKKDLVNNTKTYVAFILFTIVFGSPLLFAISLHFINVVNDLQAASAVDKAGQDLGLSFFSGDVVITTGFLFVVALVMLTLTSLLASLLMGTIKEGRVKDGLRYAPGLIIASILIFLVLKEVIARSFG